MACAKRPQELLKRTPTLAVRTNNNTMHFNAIIATLVLAAFVSPGEAAVTSQEAKLEARLAQLEAVSGRRDPLCQRVVSLSLPRCRLSYRVSLGSSLETPARPAATA